MIRMAVRVLDRLFLVVYGATSPTDRAWCEYLDLVKRQGIDGTIQLVVTDGGGPTAAQRRALGELLAGRSVPVAVVSGSLPVRALVTAMSWFNRSIKAFPSRELRCAVAYLEIPASRVELIEAELGKLRRAIEHTQQAKGGP